MGVERDFGWSLDRRGPAPRRHATSRAHAPTPAIGCNCWIPIVLCLDGEAAWYRGFPRNSVLHVSVDLYICNIDRFMSRGETRNHDPDLANPSHLTRTSARS